MRLKRPARLNIGIDLVPPSELPIEASIVSFSVRGSVNIISGEHGSPGPLADSNDARSLIASSSERRRSSVPASSAETSESDDRARQVATHVMQGDGIRFLKTYRFTGSELVYCDPPYLMETRSGRRLYQHELSSSSHRRLLRVVMEIPAKVMISGYWSEMYAETLKDWNSINFQTMTRGGKLATEWLWFNFPPPIELHDYSFLGKNFRERERIKRKKARWTARLQRMPALERQSLLSAIAEIAESSDATRLRTR